MKLNLTQADIDRLRGHAREGGAIKGEELLNLLQDWVTLEDGRNKIKAQNENQARTIQVQAATVARLESETQEFIASLKDGLSAYKLVLRGDIYLTDRQIAALSFAQIKEEQNSENLAEAVGWGDCVVKDEMEGMPWEGRK